MIGQSSKEFNIKLFLLVISMAVLGAGGIFLVDEGRRWIFFNGSEAESYAVLLLSGEVPKTPDKFIDYSVGANDGYVIFSRHGDHSIIYGYFPTRKPTDIGGLLLKADWESLDGKWFVSRP